MGTSCEHFVVAEISAEGCNGKTIKLDTENFETATYKVEWAPDGYQCFGENGYSFQRKDFSKLSSNPRDGGSFLVKQIEGACKFKIYAESMDFSSESKFKEAFEEIVKPMLIKQGMKNISNIESVKGITYDQLNKICEKSSNGKL